MQKYLCYTITKIFPSFMSNKQVIWVQLYGSF